MVYFEKHEGQYVTLIRLVCPNCRHPDVYENSDIDASNAIACSACGHSELPTAFELAREPESREKILVKVILIILAGIVFTLVGLSVIALAAFYVPVIVAAVIAIVVYRKWKSRPAQLR